MIKNMTEFFRGKEFEKRLAVVVKGWLDEKVLEEIERLTKAICKQHGVPSRALELTSRRNHRMEG
uniref:Uncharacterized protein n=1 Tax=Candidatus Kentrum sp. LFY TaxID=2126342 RepID=A0A450WVQ5_9GAMM|nr:MAG: hypothetical protein BECKLFY1418C_GA0070996_10857 [Candidatus Kentron sp. LFY]